MSEHNCVRFACCIILTLKPISVYKKTVQCGGKKGDSVKIHVGSCGKYLVIYEIKVYGTFLAGSFVINL